MLAKKVWETFRAKRVFEQGYVEKKGRYSYLSWTAAIEMLNDEFPDNEITFDRFTHPNGFETCVMYHPDGSGEVSCTITIREDGESFSKTMFLPIKDHKHHSIINPNSMAINTTKQRCIVKCLAMMGLGLHVYAGAEDDPEYVMTGREKFDQTCRDLGVSFEDVDTYYKSVRGGESVASLIDSNDGMLDSFLTYLKSNPSVLENKQLEDQQ